MTKTFAGKIGKALSVLVASALLLVSALMLSACSGRYPEISMRISFNGEEYTLNYILYRNYYQQTVDHYMELIDMDYFDGTVISDYQSDRMVAGGYRYEGENTDELIALDYEAATKDADGNVTLENITVWKDKDRTQPTNRLHGEISSNGFSIEDGSGLTNQVGALGAYTYVSSSMQATQRMHYKYSSSDNYGESEYYKNSFTGLFYLYTSSNNAPAGDYCVFGILADEDSETAFNDLLEAISTYTEDNDLDSFAETQEDIVIEDEFIDGGSYNVDFEVPVSAIVIEEVWVTKY